MADLDPKLTEYVRHTFAQEDEILKTIRAQIPSRGLPMISVKPEEGRFLQFLVASSGAQLALEIGTLGGYSGTWILRGLPANGRLITLEKNPRHASVAREHFQLAGVVDQVVVRVGDAQALLPEIRAEGPFDFIFIDAEKEAYPFYLDWSLANLSPGGVLAAHNAFRHGRILDRAQHDPSVEAIRQFNARLAQDPRLTSTIFPAGDGIAIAVMHPELSETSPPKGRATRSGDS